MVFPSGHEVYVLLDGVFELDQDVDAENDCAVRIRARNGLRISVPIDYVADWDVDTPVRGAPLHTFSSTRCRPRPRGGR
jgi:hypothetical protein